MTQTRTQTATARVRTVRRTEPTVAETISTPRRDARRWQPGTVNPFDRRVYRDFFTTDWR